jgi:hypothetical protein
LQGIGSSSFEGKEGPRALRKKSSTKSKAMKTLHLVVLMTLTIAGTLSAQTASSASTRSDANQRRQQIEQTTQRVLQERGRTMEVTSRDRQNSTAHQRGAIDIRSKDIPRTERHSEARVISRELGRNHTVIVEERNVPPIAPGYQMNTSYRNGQPVRSSAQPGRATETHTHIQPDRTVRAMPAR